MSDVVLLHGCWCHPEILRPLRESLESRGHRVHVPALPGRPGGRDISEKELGRVSFRDGVAELRSQLELCEPPILVGHSMGGLLAQLLAAEMPVRGMVLLNSAAPAGVNHIYPYSLWSTLTILLRPFFWRRSVLPTRREADFGLFNRVPVQKREEIFDSLVPESGRLLFEMVFWFLDWSLSSRVARTPDTPVLIVSGGMDRIVVPRVAQALLRRFPRATFRFFSSNGHWLSHEPGSERIFTQVGDWIDQLEERGPGSSLQKHHDPERSSATEGLAPRPDRHSVPGVETERGKPSPESGAVQS